MNEREGKPVALWAPFAWLAAHETVARGQGLARDVLCEIGHDGRWSRIDVGVPAAHAAQRGALNVGRTLLPGVIDAHSHAFQRAFAGLAERREHERDDFWSWRDRMYRVALAVEPQALRAIAAALYVELLRGGYTQVCEFHYVQHDRAGRAWSDPLTMSWMLAEAAADVGIGLTMLPVLYERAGFESPALRDDQRRFATDAPWVLNAERRVNEFARQHRAAPLNAGVAIHSLRAATPESIARVVAAAQGPLHIHVAEQTAEVEDCLRATGRRPVEWLLAQHRLDARWQLVHATHVTDAEIDGVAASGACAVICPSTEANLGDGLTDVPRWLARGTALAIGSDSHVTRDWREELRLLEYGQRLARRARNLAAAPSEGLPATAERLFARIQQGSAAAAGEASWGLRVGARADAVLADPDDETLGGMPAARTLDALVFSSPARSFRDVMVAGRWVIRDGAHADEVRIRREFADAMRALWADGV
ncbi:MAG: formimidoylglutamate deiminase [Burkholderiales bacterium]|nr:formimidoylglutamate deiminase [Burkholderiales bacterium]